MSRTRSNLIDLEGILASIRESDAAQQEQPVHPDLPQYAGRGQARFNAASSMRPQERTIIDDLLTSAEFTPLPKWYRDLGGTALKAVEGFAGGVGQFAVDGLSKVTGGLIDITGSSVDKSRAYDLLSSDDPNLRVEGQRLLDQARMVEDSSREGFRLEMKRNRETPYAGVDQDSVAGYAGSIIGNVAPSVAGLLPGMQVPVMAGYFASAYEDAYDQYADTKMSQTGTYDTTTAATVGMASGAIQAALEFLPIRGVKKAAAEANRVLVDAAMSGLPGWRQQAAKQVAKLIGLGAAQEGTEEGLSELSNEIIRLTYDADLRERYRTDPTGAAMDAAGRIARAAMAGAAGGALLGGAGFGTALAGHGEMSQESAAQDTGDIPMIEVEGDQQSTPGQQTPGQASQQASPMSSIRKDVAGSSDLMRAAFGMKNVEVAKDGRETPRVARPEAIAALRSAGKIPTTTDPYDFMHEVASDPDRYSELVEALRESPDMSRSQAEALFGEENSRSLFRDASGDGSDNSRASRKAWVESVLELADSNALDIGPSAQTDVPVPPGSAPSGINADPPDGRFGFDDDFRTRMLEHWLNKYEKLGGLQRKVEAETGASIPDSDNAVQQIRLAKSKRRYEQERFLEGPGGVRETLMSMKESGIGHADVARLAAAIHAKEANEQVAKRNPDDPNIGYGLSNDAAERIIADATRRPDSAKLFRYADWLRSKLDERTSLDETAGVLSEADRRRMGAAYEHYVATIDDPQFMQEMDGDVSGMELVPRNAYSVAKTQRLRRLGRTYGSLDDPSNPRAKALFEGMFAHAIELYERGILRRSQNHVLNTMRRFAESTEGVQRGLTVRYAPPDTRRINPRTNQVETAAEALAAYRSRPDVLYGKLDEESGPAGSRLAPGTPFYIEVGDERLADTLKTLAVPDESTERILNVFRAMTNFRRFTATSIANVAFPFGNIFRDQQTAISTIFTEHEDAAKAIRDYSRNTRPAFVAVARSMFSSFLKPDTSEFGRYYEELQSVGGTQQMFTKNDFDSAKSLVSSIMEPTAASRMRDAAESTWNALSNATKPFEDSTRLAYYVMLRKRGWSEDRAAIAARDLTVDFQVHGRKTTLLRAVKPFLNAGVQGQRKMVRMLRTPRGKYVAGLYFLSGMTRALVAYMAFRDRNEDGKSDAAQLPSWERDTMVTIPGTMVKFPAMWGMQPAQSLGWWAGETLAASYGIGNAEVDHYANAKAFANAMVDAFNPAGGSDTFSPKGAFRFALPIGVEDAFELASNEDWRGQRIYNTPFNRDQAAGWVDSEHAMETTPQAFVRVARGLNRITGGDESTPGFVDPAPETIQHLFRAILGGGARTIERIGGFVSAPYTGDVKDWTSLPIASTFVRPGVDQRAANEEYSVMSDAASTYLSRLKSYEKSGNYDAYEALVSGSPDIAYAASVIDVTDQQIEDIRDVLKETSDPEYRRELLMAIQAQKASAMGLIRAARRSARGTEATSGTP